jgi:uncharacterized short protein YbdD (DUF466 family)
MPPVLSGARFSLPSLVRWAKLTLRSAWRSLREWSGDSAYERYLRVTAAKRGAPRPLSPAEFYVEQLERRYSRPTRCC